MKRILCALVLFALLLPFTTAFAAEPALVAIESPTADTTARLLDDQVMVVRDLGRYLLAVIDADQKQDLERLNLTVNTLDEKADGHTYFIVSFRSADQAAWLQDNARILRYDTRDAVVEATQAEADAISAAGLDIARVFMRPVRTAKAEKPVYATRDVADPVIQDLVDSVDSAAVDGYVQRLQDFDTRYSTSDSCQAAADWMIAKLQSFGISDVYAHNFSTTYKDNVVAVIPGVSRPDKIILIGGHYDSTSTDYADAPGADDNASGTACMLECARVLANTPLEYTVKFVAFGGEEQGLYGSEGFASDAAAAGDDIVAAIAVDMIGYVASGDAMDIDIISNGSSAWLRDVLQNAGDLYVPELPIVTGSLPFGASSDHASFWAQGYDGLLFFEDTGNYSPYIHTPNDLVGLSYNSPLMAERSVKVAVALMATLAKPFTVAIDHTPLTNTIDSLTGYPIVANITTLNTLQPDSLLLYYSTGGGFLETTLSPTGTADEFAGLIPAQSSGTFVDYYLLAVNDEGDQATHPAGAPAETHRFFVGEIQALVSHDFESDQGWTVGGTGDDATTGVWVRANPVGTTEEGEPVQPEDDNTASPGVLCYVTGNGSVGGTQGAADVDGGQTTLLSPLFDLSGHDEVGLQYYRWFTNSTGASPGEDHWIVDVTDDDGATWVNVEDTTASRRQWTLVERSLSDLIDLTSRVRFRFIAADEGDGSIVEAAVDDFALLTYQSDVTAIDDALPLATAVRLNQNVPNPFNPSTTISYTLTSPQPVSLRVFDISGRLVKNLVTDEVQTTGQHAQQWYGRDAEGRSVAAGVYFYQLVVGDQGLTRRMTLVK